MTNDWIRGVPFILTQEDLDKPWSGYKDGRTMRCQLCGDWLRVGSTIRFILANGTRCHMGNFWVCQDCDGSREDVIDRACQLESEAKQKFWWLKERDDLPAHPQATYIKRNRSE